MEQDPNNNEKPEFGPLVGVVIIVALLVAGALYFLFLQPERSPALESTASQETSL
jgi:hypothetical protein